LDQCTPSALALKQIQNYHLQLHQQSSIQHSFFQTVRHYIESDIT